MTLQDAIEQFIAWRQSLGSRFVTQSDVLRHFLKHMDGELGCDDVTCAQVCSFLSGNGPLTQTRALKYSVLKGFFDYAISRGYASRSPLPANEPKKPQPAAPYVYSSEELRRIFDAIDVVMARAWQLDANTVRTLLLILYGAGLRVGEARRLTVADVDLSAALLTVHRSKFYKSRLVPIGPQVVCALRSYMNKRATRPLPRGRDSALLVNRDGSPLSRITVQSAFARLRKVAKIHGTDDAVQAPCLHSFRHSFAVHRLTSWYREGADVQRLLPVLSTYLGHARLSDTQVYLSMTPELLQEASLRFEEFVSASGNE